MEAGTANIVGRRPRKPITHSIHGLGSEIHVSPFADEPYSDAHRVINSDGKRTGASACRAPFPSAGLRDRMV